MAMLAEALPDLSFGSPCGPPPGGGLLVKARLALAVAE
jgi:hypothetical protein